jgi:hypothetical protein
MLAMVCGDAVRGREPGRGVRHPEVLRRIWLRAGGPSRSRQDPSEYLRMTGATRRAGGESRLRGRGIRHACDVRRRARPSSAGANA